MNRVWIVGSLLALVVSTGAAQEASDEQLRFFETRIRPVLVEHCESCHSSDAREAGDLQGGLLVDHRAGLLVGGDSGPAVVPGKPDESLLINALEYSDFEMPPEGQLPDGVIEDFRKWVREGAVDPREGGEVVRESIDLESGRQHWSYQPLVDAAVGVSTERVAGSKIDAWIQSGLAAANLTAAPLAGRRTLLRRLHYDLAGLPPSLRRIERFVADESPDALQREVDRLLASPRFAERWGRHWLDVVRYADSITLRGFLFPEAWRYRDLTIQTYNEDLAFDHFIEQQIAGDLLESESLTEQRRNRIATTFLTMGNNNLEDQDKAKLRMDVVDEQLSTIGRALLAQTIECARCHDHKFDPIPIEDYYALAGILRNTKTLEHANVSNWIEEPLPMSAERQREVEQFSSQVAVIRERIAGLRGKSQGNGPLSVEGLPGIVVDDEDAELVGEWQPSTYSKTYVGVGYRHDNAEGQGTKSAVFPISVPEDGEYEIRLSYTSGGNRASNVPVTVWSADGSQRNVVNQRVPGKILGRFVSLGRYQLTVNGDARVVVETTGADGHVILDAVQVLSESEAAELTASVEEAGRETASMLKELEAELARLERQRPDVPKAMTVREEAEIADTAIHIRGNVHSLGAEVPRGFLQVVSVESVPSIDGRESGRRQLAEWITSAENPLTPRVYANRVWHWLVGRGLVSTTDNFGTTGREPSHPELLDYLALRLKHHGWSSKRLIREIVTTEAYCRDSEPSADALRLDPENLWLSRANRRRADAEYLVDAMLSCGGALDLRYGGSTLRPEAKNDYDYEHRSLRRAVYWPVLRNSLPEMFVAFDFANPSMVVGSRDVSSTAPQSLLLMNDPWVIEQAQRLGESWMAADGLSDRERISGMVESVLGRPASEVELEAMLGYLNAGGDDPEDRRSRWGQLSQALYATLDFRFIH